MAHIMITRIRIIRAFFLNTRARNRQLNRDEKEKLEKETKREKTDARHSEREARVHSYL